MTRLEALAEAIQKHEGWYPFSRSWRNNNPGNLRWSKFQIGSAGGFATFGSYASGWLALWWDLWCKCSGRTRTGLGPGSSLQDLFLVWAPLSDGNKPYAYAAFVASRLHISQTEKLEYFTAEL